MPFFWTDLIESNDKLLLQRNSRDFVAEMYFTSTGAGIVACRTQELEMNTIVPYDAFKRYNLQYTISYEMLSMRALHYENTKKYVSNFSKQLCILPNFVLVRILNSHHFISFSIESCHIFGVCLMCRVHLISIFAARM